MRRRPMAVGGGWRRPSSRRSGDSAERLESALRCGGGTRAGFRGSSVDIQQVLRPLQQLEEKLGELYDWIAGTLAEDREIATVFHRLALDERSHAAQVEYQRRLARQNPNAFAQVDLDLAEVFAALDVVHQARQAGEALTAAKAVRLALELESGAADFHYRKSLAQLDPEVARLMGSLGRADRLHVEQLLDLAQRRGLLGPDTPVPAPPK